MLIPTYVERPLSHTYDADYLSELAVTLQNIWSQAFFDFFKTTLTGLARLEHEVSGNKYALLFNQATSRMNEILVQAVTTLKPFENRDPDAILTAKPDSYLDLQNHEASIRMVNPHPIDLIAHVSVTDGFAYGILVSNLEATEDPYTDVVMMTIYPSIANSNVLNTVYRRYVDSNSNSAVATNTGSTQAILELSAEVLIDHLGALGSHLVGETLDSEGEALLKDYVLNYSRYAALLILYNLRTGRNGSIQFIKSLFHEFQKRYQNNFFIQLDLYNFTTRFLANPYGALLARLRSVEFAQSTVELLCSKDAASIADTKLLDDVEYERSYFRSTTPLSSETCTPLQTRLHEVITANKQALMHCVALIYDRIIADIIGNTVGVAHYTGSNYQRVEAYLQLFKGIHGITGNPSIVLTSLNALHNNSLSHTIGKILHTTPALVDSTPSYDPASMKDYYTSMTNTRGVAVEEAHEVAKLFAHKYSYPLMRSVKTRLENLSCEEDILGLLLDLGTYNHMVRSSTAIDTEDSTQFRIFIDNAYQQVSKLLDNPYGDLTP